MVDAFKTRIFKGLGHVLLPTEFHLVSFFIRIPPFILLLFLQLFRFIEVHCTGI